MKSWWTRSQGGKLVLEAREVPVPQPGPGEVVVRVHAGALNRGMGDKDWAVMGDYIAERAGLS